MNLSDLRNPDNTFKLTKEMEEYLLAYEESIIHKSVYKTLKEESHYHIEIHQVHKMKVCNATYYTIDMLFINNENTMPLPLSLDTDLHTINIFADLPILEFLDKSKTNKIPKQCKHDYIPMFTSNVCKHCGESKENI